MGRRLNSVFGKKRFKPLLPVALTLVILAGQNQRRTAGLAEIKNLAGIARLQPES